MPDLTARLLDENFEEALTEAGMLFVLEQSRATNNAWRTAAFEAIRELHRRLATAKADLTAAREDVTLYRAVARTGAIVRPKVDPRTTAAWFATGGEFSIFETGDTEAEVLRKAVAAIDSARAGGGR